MKTTSTGFATELTLSHKWVAGLLAAAGLMLTVTVDPHLGSAAQLQMVLLGVLVQVSAVLAWRLDGAQEWLGRRLLLAALIGTILVVSDRWQLPALLVVLVVPVALAAPLISLSAVGKTAGLTSVILTAALILGWSEPGATWTALFAIWAIAAVMATVYRPVLQLVDWTWEYAQQAQVQLEEARDHKVRLEQVLDDLMHANAQLTRLNLVAQGLRQSAEDARSVKEQFVAHVSHELRTPLNMITGFSEMILQAPSTYGSRIPPALLADLAVIHRNADHLSNLINDVLDLSQIEARQMALQREYVALSEIINEAVTSVRPLYELRSIYLKTTVQEDLPLLLCDRTRIQEVLLNLLSNAGRFTEHGGVEVHAMSDGANAVVSVTDMGPGIAAENLPKLFQPFRQLDGSLRRHHAGTGLGLSISKQFIELHGGKIWVESDVGKGTIFTFRLPLRPPAEPSTSSEATRWLSPEWEYVQRTRPSTAPKAAVRPRLIVLEQSGNTLQRLLARHVDGVEVAAVTSLAAAHMELAKAPAQALIINGASVSEDLERLEAAEILPAGVPALICAFPGLRQAAEALGVFDLLVKPISRTMLLDALDRLQLQQGTILIVDDEPDALQLFGRIIASLGRSYRVLLARDGQEALEVMRECRPDLILLDLMMPNLDGFQVLNQQRQEPLLHNIPIIIISALDPVVGPVVSSSLAISRPEGVSIAELLAHIQALLKGDRVAAPAADPAPPADMHA